MANSDANAGSAEDLLRGSLATGRIHSAYLLSGPGEAPRRAALDFVRAVVCREAGDRACERCDACRRSGHEQEVALDGSGRKGPLLRHVGDHPDLLWVERGAQDTRVRIAQVRALQDALRLKPNEGARRAAVLADAEWLNLEAQNALLRLLEEPPPDTTLVLVSSSASGLLATVRSRCQRVAFPVPRGHAAFADDAPPELATLVRRIDEIGSQTVPQLLDWAEEYRGARAPAASAAEMLIETGSAWLRRRVGERATHGQDLRRELAAFSTLRDCRKALVQRNANPQMVAERSLLALHGAIAR